MRTGWQAGERTARSRHSQVPMTSARGGAFLPARILSLALLAGAFLLVAPAPLAFAQAHEVPPAEAGDVVALAPIHGPALIGNQRPAGGLPFARVDVAILLLGGAVITLAAAAAPFLFGPLRLATPLAIRAASAAEPLVAAAEQAAPAHARA
jgi:hypothetical protein